MKWVGIFCLILLVNPALWAQEEDGVGCRSEAAGSSDRFAFLQSFPTFSRRFHLASPYCYGKTTAPVRENQMDPFGVLHTPVYFRMFRDHLLDVEKTRRTPRKNNPWLRFPVGRIIQLDLLDSAVVGNVSMYSRATLGASGVEDTAVGMQAGGKLKATYFDKVSEEGDQLPKLESIPKDRTPLTNWEVPEFGDTAPEGFVYPRAVVDYLFKHLIFALSEQLEIGDGGLARLSFAPVARALEIHFVNVFRGGERFGFHTVLEQFKTSSATLVSELRQGDDLIAAIRIAMVCVDKRKATAVPWPEDFKKLFFSPAPENE